MSITEFKNTMTFTREELGLPPLVASGPCSHCGHATFRHDALGGPTYICDNKSCGAQTGFPGNSLEDVEARWSKSVKDEGREQAVWLGRTHRDAIRAKFLPLQNRIDFSVPKILLWMEQTKSELVFLYIHNVSKQATNQIWELLSTRERVSELTFMCGKFRFNLNGRVAEIQLLWNRNTLLGINRQVPIFEISTLADPERTESFTRV